MVRGWIALFVLTGGLIGFLQSSRQPVFQGKTVAQWCETAPPTELIAPEVVNAFGTNAAPRLVQELLHKPNRLQQASRTLWLKLPDTVRQRWNPFPQDAMRVRIRAMQWLRELGPDAGTVLPELIKAALNSSDPEIQRTAISALSAVGTNSKEARAPFSILLRNADPQIQMESAVSLCHLDGAADIAVPALIERVERSPNPHVEIYALSRIGPAAAPAVPAILSAMSRSSLCHKNGYEAFFRIGQEAAAAVPVLIDGLESSESEIRMMAVKALMQIGPAARDALPKLTELTAHTSSTLRVAAIVAKAKIEGDMKGLVHSLVSELRNPAGNWGKEDPYYLEFPLHRFPKEMGIGLPAPAIAAWHLGELGRESLEALPALEASVVQAASPEVRLIHGLAKWRIHGNSNELLPVLTARLAATKAPETSGYGDTTELRVIFSIFWEMGAEMKPAAPDLIAFIHDHSNRWRFRREALQLLQRIDPASAATISY